MEDGRMRKKIVILSMFLFFFLPKPVSASIFCTYEMKSYLKNLASNMNLSYDYIEQNENAIFTITISNVYKEFYIKEKKTGQIYYPDTSKEISEIILNNYISGQTYQFEVYTNIVNCEDEILATFYTSLPSYNPYYKEEVCKGIEESELCSKWSNHSLSKEQFIEKVEQYKQSLKKEKIEIPKEEEKLPYLLEFYLNYYYIILPVIIIGCGYFIYLYNKKDSFF